MDLNLTVLCGHLAVDAEIRQLDSGTVIIRYLVTVRTEFPRRRVDVIPVTHWDPVPKVLENPGSKGDRIWICGSAQKRFWESVDGRRGRMEIVAEQVMLEEPSRNESLV